MITSEVSASPLKTVARKLDVAVDVEPSQNAVRLKLTLSGNDKGEEVTYKAYCYMDAEETIPASPVPNTVTLDPTTGQKEVTVDIDGLLSGKSYSYKVEASYATGVGEQAFADGAFTTVAKSLSVTATPTDITTNSVKLTLTITGSSLEDVSYEVTYSLNEDMSGASTKTGTLKLKRTSGQEETVTLDDVQMGKTYYYRVVARYSDLESNPFAGTFQTIAKSLTVSATDVEIGATYAKLLLTLKGTVAERVDYVIEYGKNPDLSGSDRKVGYYNLTTNADTYINVQLDDLEPSSTYYYRINAHYSDLEADPFSGSFRTASKQLSLDAMPTGIRTTEATLVLTLSGNVVETVDYAVYFGNTQNLSGVQPVQTGQIATGQNVVVSLTGLEPETMYYYSAEATPSGMDKLSATGSFVTATQITYQEPNAIDMGLSVKWADFNLGGKVETDCGGYFGWGDATGENRSVRSGQYAPGKLFTTIGGDPNYDIATAKLGGHWRLPTCKEVEELIRMCNPTYTTKTAIRNGVAVNVKGWEMTAINGNKIFIPCAGVRTGENDTDINDLDKYAYIWTDSVAEEGIYYEIARDIRQGVLLKSRGLSVRPVYDDGTDPVIPVEPDLTNEIVPGSDQDSNTGIIPQEGVDMGTGVKWSRWNFGVTQKQGQAGRYYAWGETSEKDEYTEANYTESLKGKRGDDEDAFPNSRFPEANDVVRQVWGDKGGHKWRMPTAGELVVLINNCTITQKTVGGLYGIELTSKTNGKKLFLPAGGYKNGTSTLSDQTGYYWSSSPVVIGDNSKVAGWASMLKFDSSAAVNGLWRYYGMLIRPVYTE
jgi:hypothetical protein